MHALKLHILVTELVTFSLVFLNLKYPHQSNNTKETEHTASLPILTAQTKALTYSLAHLGHSKKNKTPLRSLQKQGKLTLRLCKKSYHDLDLDLHHVTETFRKGEKVSVDALPPNLFLVKQHLY